MSREDVIRRPAFRLRWQYLLPVVGLACGCGQNPYALQGQISGLQQQQATLVAQNRELQNRIGTMDQDNQELETMLAQSQQQVRLFEDQVTAMRINCEYHLAVGHRQSGPQRGRRKSKNTGRLRAPPRRRKIRANSSVKRSLPSIEVAGLEVRQDADVIRIELPAARLFAPGTARLLPEAGAMIDQVGAEVRGPIPIRSWGSKDTPTPIRCKIANGPRTSSFRSAGR